MPVEVCVNSLESALIAQKAGADRLELCVELGVGGVTPSYGLMRSVKEEIAIPVHVLIRPRSGDFNYSESEFQCMKNNIALCSDLGFEGVVSGILKEDCTVDIKRTAVLKELSKGMFFTFHRAFDWATDPLESLKVLEALQVDCILTSGKQTTALDGIDLLQKLHHKARHCSIMPGGGVNAENVIAFKERGFTSIHFSGMQIQQKEPLPNKVSMFSGSYLKDAVSLEPDFKKIQAVVATFK